MTAIRMQVESWRDALREVVAHAIAHRNAERPWRLPPAGRWARVSIVRRAHMPPDRGVEPSGSRE